MDDFVNQVSLLLLAAVAPLPPSPLSTVCV